jgi:hypothetical protein
MSNLDTNTRTRYFFCYNKNVSDYLRQNKNIEYITKAKHPVTNQVFCLFEKTHALQIALDEYKKNT